MKKLLFIAFMLISLISWGQIEYYPFSAGQYVVYNVGAGDTLTVDKKLTEGGTIAYRNHVSVVDTILKIPATAPYDTIETIKAAAEAINDSIRVGILFERGSHIRGFRWLIERDNMEFGTYNSGAIPILNGAEIITDWTAVPTPTYTELITNSADREFSEVTGFWNARAEMTIEDGVCKVVATSTGDKLTSSSGLGSSTIEIGKSYVVSFDYNNLGDAIGLWGVRVGSNYIYPPNSGGATLIGSGTMTDTIVANQSIVAARFVSGDSVRFELDNFSVKEVNSDTTIWVTPTQLEAESSGYRTVVVIDDDRFMPVASLSELDADLEFFAEDSTGTAGDSIYVYSLTDPSTRVAELSTQTTGIYGTTYKDITVTNLEFRQYGYAGIDFRGAQANGNVLVDNCKFYFNRDDGVHFYQGYSNAIVRNCIVSYCGNGLYANDAYDISFINNTITNTISYSVSVGFTDGHGIGAYKANNVLIEGNYMENNEGNNIGYDTPSSGEFPNNGIVRYNTLKGGTNISSCFGGNRIGLDSELDFHNNIVISGDDVKAINFKNVDGKLNIFNNTIINSAGSVDYIMRFDYADSVFFKNNIVFNPVGGATGGFIWIYYDGTPVSDNNLWYDENSMARFGKGYDGVSNLTLYPTLNDWQTAQSQDANSIESDPLFTTEFTNLQLQTGSPAINAGVDVGLTEDILGNPIVDNPDIGSYEYQP